jgi:hypothetical protein
MILAEFCHESMLYKSLKMQIIGKVCGYLEVFPICMRNGILKTSKIAVAKTAVFQVRYARVSNTAILVW